MGVVVDARGGCACGGEGRAPDDCAVVEGKPDRAGEGYTDCATALAGWAHREGHPEGTTEAGGRAGSGRRRRGRRDGQPWWQSWPEAWEKIVIAGYGREARAGAGASTRTCTDAWEFIPSKLQNSLNSGCMRRKDGVGFAVYALRVLDDVRPTTENFTWPASARGALRRCAGGHRPPWRRRGRPVVILVIGGSRGRYTPKLLGPPRHPLFPYQFWEAKVTGVGTARRWRKRVVYVLSSWPLTAWSWHCTHYTGRGVMKFYESERSTCPGYGSARVADGGTERSPLSGFFENGGGS